ncbi:MAG: hypothetical protein E6K79_09145 [Candidatus Eisenbacteria bacterium]|uniref:Uncharacterized protein n=1 Tax=Eiseniibacteriota bacterium TaxID=2212470 RepID=A0A538TJL5_UNCEI|nr:MAG: hypothetical protein E6K79_09145 [Candidatus Eisenbacteria bacterium]
MLDGAHRSKGSSQAQRTIDVPEAWEPRLAACSGHGAEQGRVGDLEQLDAVEAVGAVVKDLAPPFLGRCGVLRADGRRGKVERRAQNLAALHSAPYDRVIGRADRAPHGGDPVRDEEFQIRIDFGPVDPRRRHVEMHVDETRNQIAPGTVDHGRTGRDHGLGRRPECDDARPADDDGLMRENARRVHGNHVDVPKCGDRSIAAREAREERLEDRIGFPERERRRRRGEEEHKEC